MLTDKAINMISCKGVLCDFVCQVYSKASIMHYVLYYKLVYHQNYCTVK